MIKWFKNSIEEIRNLKKEIARKKVIREELDEELKEFLKKAIPREEGENES